MMLSTALILCLVGTAVGFKCCTPTKFQVFEGMLRGDAPQGGQARETEGSMMVYIDGDAQKIAIQEEVSSSGQDFKIQIIQDYKAGVQYVIMNNKCTNSTPGAWSPPCIPDEAADLGHTYFGSLETLQAETYQYKQGENTIVVSVGAGCTPIVTGLYGANAQDSSITLLTYMNFTVGIKDEHVFDVPAICKQSQFARGRVYRRSPLYTIY